MTVTVTITIEAQGPFSGDQRPVRTGVYMRVGAPGRKSTSWSHYSARTKLWGSYHCAPSGAYVNRTFPSAYQRIPWYALPHQIPSGARIERVSGLTFRVTEA